MTFSSSSSATGSATSSSRPLALSWKICRSMAFTAPILDYFGTDFNRLLHSSFSCCIKELGRTPPSNPAHFGKAVSAARTGKARTAYRYSLPSTTPEVFRRMRCNSVSDGGSRKCYGRDTEHEVPERTSPDDRPSVSRVMLSRQYLPNPMNNHGVRGSLTGIQAIELRVM